MAVAFGNIERAIDLGDLAARFQARRIGAEPHRAALVGGLVADDLLVALGPFFHQADQRLFGRAEFTGRGILDAGQVAGRLNHRQLHPVADAEARHRAFAREPRRAHFAMRAALTEAARQDHAMHAFKNVQWHMLVIELF